MAEITLKSKRIKEKVKHTLTELLPFHVWFYATFCCHLFLQYSLLGLPFSEDCINQLSVNAWNISLTDHVGNQEHNFYLNTPGRISFFGSLKFSPFSHGVNWHAIYNQYVAQNYSQALLNVIWQFLPNSDYVLRGFSAWYY